MSLEDLRVIMESTGKTILARPPPRCEACRLVVGSVTASADGHLVCDECKRQVAERERARAREQAEALAKPPVLAFRSPSTPKRVGAA